MAAPSEACLVCDYDLGGIDRAAPCPECGASAAAARELPPLTVPLWARTVLAIVFAPRRALARASCPRESAMVLVANLLLGWTLIGLAALLPAFIENFNDDRRDGDPALLALIAFGPIALVYALVGGAAGTFVSMVGFALTGPLAAAIARLAGRRARWRRVLSVASGASYIAVPVSVAAFIVALGFCAIAIVRFDGVGSPVSWFTGGSMAYLGLPAGAAALILPCLIMFWGVFLTSPRRAP